MAEAAQLSVGPVRKQRRFVPVRTRAGELQR